MGDIDDHKQRINRVIAVGGDWTHIYQQRPSCRETRGEREQRGREKKEEGKKGNSCGTNKEMERDREGKGKEKTE
jgi:hypothetical protein